MTKKIFWKDSYLTQLETYITGVKGNDITVEQTIFFAFSGGQESDHGTIGNSRVLQARTEDREIVYTLEQGHGLRTGDPVSLQIDWGRRYQLMRLHFAAEIVLELTYRNLESIKKIGAHIAQDKARIDFEWGGNISNVLTAIQKEALSLIETDQEIISAFSNEETEERYWEIRGFARVPCGGTHLKRTGEIGEIELKRKNPGKGKERVEIFLISPPPLDACLREAPPCGAKAGGRMPAAPGAMRGERVATGSGSAPEGLLTRRESLWLGEGLKKEIWCKWTSPAVYF